MKTTDEFTTAEASSFWSALHGAARTDDDGADLLRVVCHATAPAWFNARTARLQRAAFERALAVAGHPRGRRVLEVGCGSARWSRVLRDRGAHVLATDVAPDAIERNRALHAGIRFEVADLGELALPERDFDLAVSVTVIQHLRPEAQDAAARALVEHVRTGGRLLLLENVRDHGHHVFARSPDDWVALFERHGCRTLHVRSYDFDVAGRAVSALAHAARPAPRPDAGALGAATPRAESPARRLYWAARRPLAMASDAAEPLLRRVVPARLATHCAFVFERRV